MDDAYEVWYQTMRLSNDVDPKTVFTGFYKYIGHSSYAANRFWCGDNRNKYFTTPEGIEKLKSLAGPHGQTLVKAWFAKKQ